jgi:hypothetical protein
MVSRGAASFPGIIASFSFFSFLSIYHCSVNHLFRLLFSCLVHERTFNQILEGFINELFLIKDVLNPKHIQKL